jgi:hypothetical protein
MDKSKVKNAGKKIKTGIPLKKGASKRTAIKGGKKTRRRGGNLVAGGEFKPFMR